jgi:ABC-type sugar transport system ATPase subunit
MKSLKLLDLTKRSRDAYYYYNIGLKFQPGLVYGIVSHDDKALGSLIKVLSGFERSDGGQICFDKQPVIDEDLKALVGVASSSFEPVENLSVSENIFLGSMHNLSFYGIITKYALRRRAAEILASLATTIDSGAKISSLGDNHRRIIEIARLLAKSPDVYIFDRITRSLSTRQYEALFSLISELKKLRKVIIMIPCGPEDVRTFIDSLHYLNNAHFVEVADCKNLSTKVVDEIFLSGGKIEETVVNDPIFKAQLLIEKNATEPNLNYQSIAQTLAMSYENFRRRFKRETGMSPNQFFLKVKMDKAKEMLMYSSMSVKSVAEALGFSDPYHFSKLFKEKEKVSPVQYRKEKREGSTDPLYDE